jgi:hypothetical protein
VTAITVRSFPSVNALFGLRNNGGGKRDGRAHTLPSLDETSLRGDRGELSSGEGCEGPRWGTPQGDTLSASTGYKPDSLPKI